MYLSLQQRRTVRKVAWNLYEFLCYTVFALLLGWLFSGAILEKGVVR